MPLTQAGLGQGVAPIGAKVIEGFGKALRKAIGEVPKSKPKEESCFHSELKKMPDIEEFVWHLHQSGCPPVCFVYAFVYICRMSELNSGKVELSPRTVHRLLLAAITVAAKMQQPESFDASFYAHVGDVSVAELNQLESKFFELLQWKADVPWQTCQFHSICINSPFWSYEAKASEARNSFGESPNWCDLKTHPSHPQPVMT
ncbi:unnamed protein product [Durusdinium trenchii]|uniref:Cyclin-P3-1 (CycP3) n=2 Tax=Durusdinium trenchii TaxID=1381693 RepID=A0ABP0QAG7_9DINO